MYWSFKHGLSVSFYYSTEQYPVNAERQTKFVASRPDKRQDRGNKSVENSGLDVVLGRDCQMANIASCM